MDRRMKVLQRKIDRLRDAEIKARRDVRDRCMETVQEWARWKFERGEPVDFSRLMFLLRTMRLKPRRRGRR